MKTQDGAGRRWLSCYYPLGDPRVPVDLLDVYTGEGVDVLEIGMASPDPYLDGPDVRASMARASRDQWQRDLEAVANRLARLQAPPCRLLMTYADAAHPGLPGSDRGSDLWPLIDSLLVVAPEGDHQAMALEAAAEAAGLPLAAFVALPLTDTAMARAARAGLYVMLQAATGVTGPRAALDPGNRDRLARLRAAGIQTPILAGFGIANGAQAGAAVAMGADGVVVGSQVLRAALAGGAELAHLLSDLRKGIDWAGFWWA